jgi:hypothetical protein
MKVIDKEGLKQLIDDLVIEDIQITEPINALDVGTLQGRAHLLNREGGVKLVITGRVEKPDEQL